MEVAYCHDQGIPHSRFLAEWDPEDRAKVAAYLIEQADQCSGCGTAAWEWAEDRFAYMAVRQTCPGCQAKDLLRDDDEEEVPPGTSVVLVPRAKAEQLLEEQRAAEIKRRRRDAVGEG